MQNILPMKRDEVFVKKGYNRNFIYTTGSGFYFSLSTNSLSQACSKSYFKKFNVLVRRLRFS